ncbi:MAG: hypothetical protein JWQ27_2912 [Ferruginibacter sp.]|nr:hypothetical protein [Ferruginibacter sp.]
MKYMLALGLIASLPFAAAAQKLHGDLYLGAANYQGDLQTKRVTLQGAKPAVGLGLSYDISNHFIARTAFSFMQVTGDDKRNTTKQGNTARNLNFKTNILEGQLGVEYNILDLTNHSLTPYVFAGVAVFHYDPFTFDSAGTKVFLQPLGTEGQGLSLYPDRKLYKKTDFAIPFGGGLKLALSDRLQVGVELGLRKLFTDYLDDVSTTYADSAALFAGRGAQAVELSYRGDEIKGGVGYPAAGTQRGSAKYKDWYYTTGFRISYLFGGGNGGGRKTKTGCPVNVY